MTDFRFETITGRRMTMLLAGFITFFCISLAAEPSARTHAINNSPGFATLTVLITRSNGTVISGAGVCVAPATGDARSDFTDAAGRAVFDGIAQGQVTITVNAAGFTGQSHTSSMDAAGGTARFILESGSGGPICRATTPPNPSAKVTLQITSFDWHLSRRTPLFFEAALSFAATKTPGGAVVPGQYRVGETQDLSSVPWVTYSGGVITFQLRYLRNNLTGYGQRTLFFQMKDGNVESQVISKTVSLAPVQMSEYGLEGANLASMVNYATDRGFPLRTATLSATQNQCSSIEFKITEMGFAIPGATLKDAPWNKVVEVHLLSVPKAFTAFWRVKRIEIGTPASGLIGSPTVSGSVSGDGFKVTITLHTNSSHDTLCFANPLFPLKAIVLEGPADDLALDQAN